MRRLPKRFSICQLQTSAATTESLIWVFFENDDAGKYEVREQCIGSHGGDVLALLYLKPKMMGVGFDFSVRRVNTGKGSYFSKTGR